MYVVFYATVPIAFLFQAQLFCDPHQCILRFPSEKWSSVNKQQKMYENKSWTVQEVHDGKAFERGVSCAPFLLQFSDLPGDPGCEGAGSTYRP